MVLGELQHSIDELLAAAPEGIRKAFDVDRAFGIDHRLGWQIYRVAKADNPLAAGSHVPSKISMDKFLKAATRRKIPREIVDRVAEAFAEFERLVETDAGDRESLEAMISAFLPEEREKYELAGKQMAFQGISRIKGVAMEANVNACFVIPSEDSKKADTMLLLGQLGLRRLRPEAPIVVGVGHLSSPNDTRLNLDGAPPGPLSDDGTKYLLREFCSPSIPKFEAQIAEDMAYYTVADEQVGLRSAIDLIMATRHRGALRRYFEAGTKPITGFFHTVDTPTKRATIDIFVHRDLFPGKSPLLEIYDTTERGLVTSFEDPKRRHDRLQLQETIRPLPPGLASARLAHVPRYVELLEHICRRAGIDIAHFRGYRLDMQYPFYGAQCMIGFDLRETTRGK
jgi:hypothetical protein